MNTITGRVTARAAAVAITVAGLLAGLVAPAAADTRRTDRWPVAPGIAREHWHHDTAAGTVHVDVLRFQPSDPRVDLTPELGQGTLYGFEATHQATQRLAPTAVAGVNAHFFSWSGDPLGEPRGYLIRDGAYLSEPERGRNWRGAFGLTEDLRSVFGHVGFLGRLGMPEGFEIPVDGVQRRPARPTEERPETTEITALDPRFATTTGTPQGTVEVILPGVQLSPAFTQEATVAEVRTAGDVPIPRDGIVLSATGERARQLLEGLERGDEVTVRFEISAGWGSLKHAVQGGPMIIDGGRRTSASSWENEGFNAPSHSGGRHPRTIVGVAAGGEMLLVTADGRTSTSPGLTMAESQDLMLALGAREAVHMDGGGSTTMAVDDRIVNDPCCDRGGFRRVSTNLVLHSLVAPPEVPRLGSGDRYTRSASIATAEWPDGARIALLASGESFPDGLAGAPLAHRLGGPLLLTRQDSLPTPVLNALEELGTDRVGVLGGRAAVSAGVVEDLRDHGIQVHRLAGRDRFETAARLAQVLGRPDSGRAFLAAAYDFPDALGAGVAAAVDGAPVLLTPEDELHPRTLRSLRELQVREVVVAGGTAAVSAEVATALEEAGFAVTRLAGSDRYGTATALTDWARTNGLLGDGRAMLATGLDFDSALMAGPVAAKRRTALLLTHPLELERARATFDWLRRHAPVATTLIGERAELSSWLARQVDELGG